MNSIEWNTLKHAYGLAGDIPGLLATAEESPPAEHYHQEPWFSLWSSLCHQGDVYTASYAAVPRLVEIARKRRGAVGRECLLLTASIEMNRHSENAPVIPPDLRPQYEAALRDGERLAQVLLGSAVDELDRRVFRGAIAAFEGNVESAREILDPEE